MALLANPSFEDGVPPWQAVNIANAVSLNTFGGGLARSGGSVLAAFTTTPQASVAQDFQTNERSVFGFAWVRAWTNPVSLVFAIWDLDANRNVSASFTVDQNWTLITNTIGLRNPGAGRNVRFEFYLQTPNFWLLVDNANAF